MVNFIHCKICATNKDALSSHPLCIKGNAKKSMMQYVKGTNYVTKHNIMRHISSKAHDIAIEKERTKPENETILVESKTGYSQPEITTVFKKSSVDVYKKMFRTAYELAMQPTMPFRHFATLVKVQRINGVRLVEGKDDSRAAAEFIAYLAEEVCKKIKLMINASDFFAILSDGSQARKIKSEKELILSRIVKEGSPVYVLTALLEMSRLVYTYSHGSKC